MKKIISIAFALQCCFVLGQNVAVGINTSSPDPSAILEVKSASKGVLFPRLNITNANNKSPVTATPKDGLLAYNSGTASGTSNTLYSWNSDANSGTGAWNKFLYFKETPKVAYIGLTNNVSKLDNFWIGDSESLVGGATNNFYIINSGYIPLLNFAYDPDFDEWDIVLGQGTYTLEIIHSFNAPPANPSSRATPIQGSYYNMGYFSDLNIYKYNVNTGVVGSGTYSARVEGATISKVNEDHKVRLVHSFEITQPSAINLMIGRMASSSFLDLVNLNASGTFIKITKLK